ncbi:TPR-like protein [Hesseltinella vesiculosa]|uniref:TPR-like protein n=1 Tax=Hesseltinella vesiculosa TaxID=101127 RepID=A0A1X2GNV4_9FUNG|nr:TPR-like protein [Hesseltinella vesiculosa]
METKILDQTKLDLDLARCQGQWQHVQTLVGPTSHSVLEQTAQLEVDLIQLLQKSRQNRQEENYLEDEPHNISPPLQLFPYEVSNIQQQLESIVQNNTKPTLTTPDEWQAQLTRIILARTFYESGQYDRAVQELQKLALRLEDVNEGYGFVLLIQARVIKGISLEMMGRIPEALDAFESACKAMDERKTETGITLATWIEEGLYRAIMLAVNAESVLAVKFMRSYTQLSSSHWTHQWRAQKQWVIFNLYANHLVDIYTNKKYPHPSTNQADIQKAAFDELFTLMNRFRGLIRAYASKLPADLIDTFITKFNNLVFHAHDAIGWGQISHIRRVRQFLYHASTLTFNNPSISRGLFYTLLRLGHFDEAKYALRTYLELVGLPDGTSNNTSMRGDLSVEAKVAMIKAKLNRSSHLETTANVTQILVTGALFYARELRQGNAAIVLANLAVAIVDDASTDPNQVNPTKDSLAVQCHRTRGVSYGLLASQTTEPEKRANYQKESIKSLETATTLDTNQWQTYYELAYQQLQMRDTKAAASSITCAIKLNTDHLPSWVLLALVYTSQQKLTEALTILEHALAETQAADRLVHLDTSGAPALSWTNEINCLDLMNTAESLVQIHLVQLSCIAQASSPTDVLPQLSDMFSLYSVLTTHLGIADAMDLEKDSDIVLRHPQQSAQQQQQQQQQQQLAPPSPQHVRRPSIKQITTISSPVSNLSQSRFKQQDEAYDNSAAPDFTRRLPSGGSLTSFSSNPALLESLKSRAAPARPPSNRGLPESKTNLVRRGSQSLKKSLYQLESTLSQKHQNTPPTPNASAILVNGIAGDMASGKKDHARPSPDFSLASVLAPSLSMASMRSHTSLERSSSFVSVLGSDQVQKGRLAYSRNNFLHYQRDRWNALLVKIWLFATDMFVQAGQFEEANKAISETEAVAPGEADVWYAMGELCVKAMGPLDKSDDDTKYIWTKAQWRLREMALEAFRKALTLDENHKASQVALAMLLTQIKELDLAEGYLERATRAFGWDDPQGWCLLGQVYQAQSRVESAKDCYFYALELNNTQPIQPLNKTITRFA